MRLLIVGPGFVGARLARRAMAAGFAVAGTCRSGQRAAVLTAAGIEPVPIGDASGEALAQVLARATHVLCSAPPDAGGDPLVSRLLALAAPAWRWLGYLSTTGVYGDRAGGWVDETTPVAPSSDRARRRVVAETQWLELGRASGAPTHIFRLPGIYGPGRSAFDQIRAGTARRIDKAGQVFSRVHAEDIATTIMASIARPRTGAIYNVADHEPAPQADVVAHAFTLMGLPVPPAIPYDEIAPTLSPMARSFYAESRRVRADPIRTELGVELAYPTYREGLAGILAEERDTSL